MGKNNPLIDTRKMVVRFVPRRYQDLVQSRTVLGALFRYRFADTEKLTRATRRLWQARVHDMKQAGYPKFNRGPNDPKTDRYFASLACRPTFVAVATAGKACNLAGVCPFCWARDVRLRWLKVDAAFFADPADGTKRLPRSIYSLATRSEVKVFRPAEVPPAGQRPARAFLTGRAAARKTELLTLMGKTPKTRYGVLESTRLTPVRREGEGLAWRAEVRQLFLLPRGFKAGGLKVTEGPNREDVLKAVAWVLKYPRFLLARKTPVETVKDYVRLRTGVRLTATGGLFHGGTEA